MKKYALNDITLMQYILLIHGAQVGVGLLTLPRDLADKAGMDGWISLLIGWAAAVIASVLIIQVMKKHPDQTLYDLIPRYFGRGIGMVLRIVVSLYFLYAFFTSFVASVSLIKIELLPKTPDFFLVLLLAVPVYVIGRNHIRVLGRYAELSLLGGILLFLLYLYPVKYSIWLNLLPVLRDGWQPVLAAVKMTGLSFLGFETAFVLYPFLKHKEHAVMGIVIGNTISLIVYLTVTIICFVFFSPDGITSYLFPTIRTIKVIEFRFLERIEIIFLVGYVFMLSRVWIFNVYCGVFGVGHLLGKPDHRPYLRIVLIVLLLSFLFGSPSYEQIDRFKALWGQIGIWFAFAFPLFLWSYTTLIGRFRKEK